MKDKITFAQFGCGRMGRHTAQYAMEKGAEMVAAFDMNPSITGKDFGEVIGKEKTGVVISSAADADRILGELKPDICIITTQSMMKDVKDIMLA